MRKKQVAHISQLKRWDRFYLHTDRKKEVWTMIEHTAMDIKGEIRKVSLCVNDLNKQQVFFSSRRIIFLRNGTRLNAQNKVRSLFTTL